MQASLKHEHAHHPNCRHFCRSVMLTHKIAILTMSKRRAASNKLRRPRGFAAAHPMRIADGRTLTHAPRHCTPVLVAMPTAVWCLRLLRQYDLRSLRSCSISAPSSILSLCDSRDAFRSAMYELAVRSLRCAVQRATCNVQRTALCISLQRFVTADCHLCRHP